MNIIMMSYSDTIYDFIASVMPRLQSFIGSSIDFVFSLFVVFVVLMYLFFILSDYENISVEFKQLIPQKYRGTVEMVINDLEDGMNKYFRGQFLIAFIVGVLIAIGLYIVGLPLGILLGFMMGVLNVIPYMKLVMLPLLVFFSFIGAQGLGIPYWVELLKVFAVVGGVQVFEDMFLVPKIMGGKMGLRPAVILLSLSIWGSLLGVAGMIIALPLTTILLSYYRRYVLNRMDKGTGEKDSAELQTTTKE